MLRGSGDRISPGHESRSDRPGAYLPSADRYFAIVIAATFCIPTRPSKQPAFYKEIFDRPVLDSGSKELTSHRVQKLPFAGLATIGGKHRI
jgi:hypothetical protein